MIAEKSCGGIIYQQLNGLKYLLIKMKLGHWSFPKGHQENNETDHQTAIREIKEETNIDVELDDEVFDSIVYSPQKGVLKTVNYFIGKAITNHYTIPKQEISEIKWASYDDAINLLTFENDRILLRKANDILNKINN